MRSNCFSTSNKTGCLLRFLSTLLWLSEPRAGVVFYVRSFLLNVVPGGLVLVSVT